VREAVGSVLCWQSGKMKRDTSDGEEAEPAPW
jgi:hypothetical protein